VKSEELGRQGIRTIGKHDGAKPLDSAEKHAQLLRVPHVVAPLMEFLEVAVRTGEADTGRATLEPVELAKETSGQGLGEE
jgi:hypothetical protein